MIEYHQGSLEAEAHRQTRQAERARCRDNRTEPSVARVLLTFAPRARSPTTPTSAGTFLRFMNKYTRIKILPSAGASRPMQCCDVRFMNRTSQRGSGPIGPRIPFCPAALPPSIGPACNVLYRLLLVEWPRRARARTRSLTSSRSLADFVRRKNIEHFESAAGCCPHRVDVLQIRGAMASRKRPCTRDSQNESGTSTELKPCLSNCAVHHAGGREVR